MTDLPDYLARGFGRGTKIPSESRRILRRRDAAMCVRCFSSVALEWHHRRTRNVVDRHQHCACNGVLLDHTCHQWVHKNPEEARVRGLIVSSFIAEPFTVPLLSFGQWRALQCDGSALSVDRAMVFISELDNHPVISGALRADTVE